MQDDEVLATLDELIVALQGNAERIGQAIKRTEDLRRRRLAGDSWTDIVTQEEKPLIVELLAQNIAALSSAGSRLRRLKASALHSEGMSMERIAKLFGVSRQRVSELLRESG